MTPSKKQLSRAKVSNIKEVIDAYERQIESIKRSIDFYKKELKQAESRLATYQTFLLDAEVVDEQIWKEEDGSS